MRAASTDTLFLLPTAIRCNIRPCVVVCLLAGIAAGCRDEPVRLGHAVDVRPVRVLLAEASGPLRVRVDGLAVILDSTDLQLATLDSPVWVDVEIVQGNDQSLVKLGDLATASAVNLVPEQEATTQLAVRRNGKFETRGPFDGTLRIEATDDGKIRVIGSVDVETYVAGVVCKEVWPQFHDEALLAQAICARTYVLYQMAQRWNRDYDVGVGEGDQVYASATTGKFGNRVRDAVNRTSGLVLAYDTDDGPRIFCSFYSSACGGRSQSLAQIRPGAVPPPLAGGVACDYCRIARGDVYRWPVSQISKSELFKRLARRYEKVRGWGAVASVKVERQTPGGRVGIVSVVGPDGEKLQLRGEWFRQIVGNRIMRSTDCTLADVGDAIRFENGKGFGHGLGLCQWGAEGQARKGRAAPSILGYYFPSSHLVRAY